MHKYEYRAQNKNGKIVKGKTYAMNNGDLASKLKDLDLILISGRKTITLGEKVGSRELIINMSFLQKMLQIGLPIPDVLLNLAKNTKRDLMKSVILDMYKSVRSGGTMHAVMARYKNVFNINTVAIVRAGEQAGGLPSALNDAINYLTWQEVMRKKATQALIRPALLLTVIMTVTTLMIALVLPKMLQITDAMGGAIPLPTIILLAVSNFLQKYIFLIIGIIIITVITYKILYKSKIKFAIKADYYKTKMPLFGTIIMKMNVANFCNLFAVCLSNHVDIINGLKISQRVIDNKYIHKVVLSIAKSVADGAMLSNAFMKTNFFSPLIIKLIKIGEESGEIIPSFQKIKDFYDVDVNNTLDLLIASIAPMVTIFSGLLLAWIIMGIFGPIYGSIAHSVSQA